MKIRWCCSMIFSVGSSQVFFKAGLLGQLEDMRDARLSQILTIVQAMARGKLMRMERQKMMLQRSIRQRLDKTNKRLLV